MGIRSLAITNQLLNHLEGRDTGRGDRAGGGVGFSSSDILARKMALVKSA
jgi:hypothetical protein